MIDPTRLIAGSKVVYGEERYRRALRRARADPRCSACTVVADGERVQPRRPHARADPYPGPCAASLRGRRRRAREHLLRRHLRHLLPRARYRAGRLHHPDHAADAVRPGAAHRLDRPHARLRAGERVPHALQPRDRRAALWRGSSKSRCASTRASRARTPATATPRPASTRSCARCGCGSRAQHGTPLSDEEIERVLAK